MKSPRRNRRRRNSRGAVGSVILAPGIREVCCFLPQSSAADWVFGIECEAVASAKLPLFRLNKSHGILLNERAPLILLQYWITSRDESRIRATLMKCRSRPRSRIAPSVD